MTAHYNPRDCYARVHAIRSALGELERAASRLSFAWSAEILRRHPDFADCVHRVPPAKSEAELAEVQAAFHAALLAVRDEAARDVVVVADEPVPAAPPGGA